MRIFFVLFVFLGSLASAAEKPVVISGFDDVLRQAENTSLIKAALKIFEDDKTFSGMAGLYDVLVKDRTPPRFYLVSAISSLFEKRIDRFLQASFFPTNQRYLRNWFTEWSIEEFKLEKVKEIISREPQRKFIVIFDNSDASLSLAKILHQQFPNEITAIYLRQVVKKDLTEGTIGFYTAFDIALHEYQQRRLSLAEVTAIGEDLSYEKKVDLFFPPYAVCPADYNPCTLDSTEIKNICEKVRDHVQSLCRKKN